MPKVTTHPSRWNALKMKLLILFSVIGPGIIAGTADNDAGGIAVYSVAGASFGYKMLWLLIIVAIILGITQEMGARLGLITGKGLAALIRENFTLKTTLFIVVITFVANWANILAEYAAISSIADMYGMPRYLAVPLAALLIWWIVYKGSFRIVQKVFLTSSLLFFSYVLAGFLSHPDWAEAGKSILVPSVPWDPNFLYIAVAVIGTTITAWGQFFVQSYFVDKGVASEHLKYARWDVIIGAFWTGFVAFFIVVATAGTLYVAGIQIQDASQAAIALEPLAGTFAKHLFAWGLLNASLLGLAVIAMTSSYLVTEAFGWEGRVDLKKESPTFYRLFGFSVVSAALVILIPKLPLVTILVGSQMLNTFVLPFLFFTILVLLNKGSLMGEHKNGWISNLISCIAVAFIVSMALALVVLTLFHFGVSLT
ncbi:MAG: Nramp family divalent metal transporter [Candidatus Peregrinibacteria bacterium]